MKTIFEKAEQKRENRSRIIKTLAFHPRISDVGIWELRKQKMEINQERTTPHSRSPLSFPYVKNWIDDQKKFWDGTFWREQYLGSCDMSLSACLLSEPRKRMNLDDKRFLFWGGKKSLKRGFTVYHLQNDRASWAPCKTWWKGTTQSTSLGNSEHLEQEHLFTYYKISDTENSRVRGEKVIHKSTGNHNGIHTEGGVEEYF